MYAHGEFLVADRSHLSRMSKSGPAAANTAHASESRRLKSITLSRPLHLTPNDYSSHHLFCNDCRSYRVTSHD